jgi:hypothetical protein
VVGFQVQKGTRQQSVNVWIRDQLLHLEPTHLHHTSFLLYLDQVQL